MIDHRFQPGDIVIQPGIAIESGHHAHHHRRISERLLQVVGRVTVPGVRISRGLGCAMAAVPGMRISRGLGCTVATVPGMRIGCGLSYAASHHAPHHAAHHPHHATVTHAVTVHFTLAHHFAAHATLSHHFAAHGFLAACLRSAWLPRPSLRNAAHHHRRCPQCWCAQRSWTWARRRCCTIPAARPASAQFRASERRSSVCAETRPPANVSRVSVTIHQRSMNILTVLLHLSIFSYTPMGILWRA